MLDNADTEGLKPTYQVTGLKNVSRADVLLDYGYATDELLKNLPAKDGRYIKVKRMLG
jgi:Asp-tRNA(Asn)/Glu-tRNA(Gln) amidotransferase C subunit